MKLNSLVCMKLRMGIESIQMVMAYCNRRWLIGGCKNVDFYVEGFGSRGRPKIVWKGVEDKNARHLYWNRAADNQNEWFAMFAADQVPFSYFVAHMCFLQVTEPVRLPQRSNSIISKAVEYMFGWWCPWSVTVVTVESERSAWSNMLMLNVNRTSF